MERLERALALFMVVAWRIDRLMRLARICPELDAALLFDRDEWRADALDLRVTRVPTILGPDLEVEGKADHPEIGDALVGHLARDEPRSHLMNPSAQGTVAHIQL